MRKPVVGSMVVAAVLAAALPASAGDRSYRGETSAGTKISFGIHTEVDRMWLRTLRYHAILTCDDTSTIEYWSGWWFGGRGIPLDGRRLAYHPRFGSEALHIEGRFRAQTADGTFRNSQAWLTDDEQPQLCTTGDLTWTVTRRSSDGDRPEGRPDRVVHRHGVTMRLWVET